MITLISRVASQSDEWLDLLIKTTNEHTWVQSWKEEYKPNVNVVIGQWTCLFGWTFGDLFDEAELRQNSLCLDTFEEGGGGAGESSMSERMCVKQVNLLMLAKLLMYWFFWQESQK